MKKSFIHKNFKKLLEKKETQREVSNDEIYTVGIITTSEISNTIDIPKFVEEILGLENIRIYIYRPYSKKDVPSYKHFTEKDFNWRGKIKDSRLNDFCNEPFDLLIGYFAKPNLFVETIVLQSEAKFKVGFSNINQHLFDIEFSEVPSKIESFLEELKKYLLILQKIKN